MNIIEVFFSGWNSIVRTIILGVGGYLGMLLIVRVGGHRTLAQLNAFDLVVTVALGSTLSSVVVSSDVALSQGLLAFALLAGMQFTIARLALRSHRWAVFINGEPKLLVHRGKMLRETMKKCRITVEEIEATVREAGCSTVDVHALVLETNGRLSVVPEVRDGRVDAIPPASTG